VPVPLCRFRCAGSGPLGTRAGGARSRFTGRSGLPVRFSTRELAPEQAAANPTNRCATGAGRAGQRRVRIVTCMAPSGGAPPSHMRVPVRCI